MNREAEEVRSILQGRGLRIGDIPDREACFVTVVRSPVSRGVIEGIGMPELPPRVRALTAADIPGTKELTVFGVSVPILAEGRVRYKGEPVLLLAGPDETELEELAEKVAITCREEEPFLNFTDPAEEQIACSRTVNRGKVDEAMAGAARRVTGEYATGTQEHYTPETQAVYARWNRDRTRLTLLSPSSWPFHVHETLANCLRLPRKALAVESAPAPETCLDGKLWYSSLVAAHAGLAAAALGKNIKIRYSREEDFFFSPKRSPAHLRYTAGLDATGRLQAMDVQILVNTGAYPVFARETLDRAAAAALGGYHCPAVRVRASAVTTNLPPLGPFAGMGSAMSLFAMELFADKLRKETDRDPVSWKKENLASPRRRLIIGETPRSSLPDPALLDLAHRMSDFNRKHAAFELARKRGAEKDEAPESLRGIGLALGSQVSGFFGAGEASLGTTVRVSLDMDGKARICSSAVPGSHALHRIWRRLAGESLGIPPEEIEIAGADTSTGPDTGPAVFSRNITIVTRTMQDACELIKKKRFRSPLPLTAAKRYRLPRSAGWNDQEFTGGGCAATAWAAAVVEVRVDPLTFLPEIAGVWLAVDAGTVLDEKEARRAMETGISQAFGWALFERMTFRRGRVPRDQFLGYRLPPARDLPNPEIAFLEAGGKRPVKGIGELAMNSLPAAFVGALSQAVGVDIRNIPVSLREEDLTPEAAR